MRQKSESETRDRESRTVGDLSKKNTSLILTTRLRSVDTSYESFMGSKMEALHSQTLPDRFVAK